MEKGGAGKASGGRRAVTCGWDLCLLCVACGAPHSWVVELPRCVKMTELALTVPLKSEGVGSPGSASPASKAILSSCFKSDRGCQAGTRREHLPLRRTGALVPAEGVLWTGAPGSCLRAAVSPERPQSLMVPGLSWPRKQQEPGAGCRAVGAVSGVCLHLLWAPAAPPPSRPSLQTLTQSGSGRPRLPRGQ